LLELLIFLVFPVFVDVLLIEIVFLRWDEGSLNLLVPKVLPSEVFQPGMILDLCRPIKP
jgi:hypothetical protein